MNGALQTMFGFFGFGIFGCLFGKHSVNRRNTYYANGRKRGECRFCRTKLYRVREGVWKSGPGPAPD